MPNIFLFYNSVVLQWAIFFHFNFFYLKLKLLNKFLLTKFTWNIGAYFTWISCETRFTCNSREIFHMNFTWNEFHVKFTWQFHVKFTWNKFHVKFMWNSRENFTWNSRETRFTWNSHAAIFPVYRYYTELEQCSLQSNE